MLYITSCSSSCRSTSLHVSVDFVCSDLSVYILYGQYLFYFFFLLFCLLVFFQAEDGIRYLVRSRGLGDVYKRQILLYERWLCYDESIHWLMR